MFTPGPWLGNSVQPGGVDVCGTSYSHEAPRREVSGAGGTCKWKADGEVLEEKEQTSREMSLLVEISHRSSCYHLQIK